MNDLYRKCGDEKHWFLTKSRFGEWNSEGGKGRSARDYTLLEQPDREGTGTLKDRFDTGYADPDRRHAKRMRDLALTERKRALQAPSRLRGRSPTRRKNRKYNCA